ncbi:hypothetical protein [Micromonospora sp. WMMD714]|uniref:hypothetical protein n=1 Tax=Micromonospora sp. WMMD714 TaxID=3016097 RepID=UPI00249A0ACC|nr:hypothetical protein [Micromonospora sp. WMMD714]WFE63360.1 hypothetical protein O7625_08720 [Micromonospora sp. WMMD714]
MPPRKPRRAKGQRRPAEPPPSQPTVPQSEPSADRRQPEPPATPPQSATPQAPATPPPPASPPQSAVTPQPPSDEQPEAGADRSTRRKLLLAAGGTAASAVIGAVIGAVANRITSSEQAVRDDRAVEQAKRTEAQRKPPIAANAYYYNRSNEAVAWILPVPLTGDQRQQLLTRQWSPHEGMESFPDVVYGVARSTHGPVTRLLTRIRISVIGQWTGPVFVRQIRARVLKRSAPMSGTLLYQGSEGDGEPLKIGFDLDDPESVARMINPQDDTLGPAYVDSRTLTLTPGEPLTIDVQAYTDRSYCEWVVELELDLQGEKRLHMIDDHGRPFRSTGLAQRYQDRYYVHLINGWTADGAGPPVGKK